MSHVRYIHTGGLANKNVLFSPFLIELAEGMNKSLGGVQIKGSGSDKEG